MYVCVHWSNYLYRTFSIFYYYYVHCFTCSFLPTVRFPTFKLMAMVVCGTHNRLNRLNTLLPRQNGTVVITKHTIVRVVGHDIHNVLQYMRDAFLGCQRWCSSAGRPHVRVYPPRMATGKTNATVGCTTDFRGQASHAHVQSGLWDTVTDGGGPIPRCFAIDVSRSHWTHLAWHEQHFLMLAGLHERKELLGQLQRAHGVALKTFQ